MMNVLTLNQPQQWITKLAALASVPHRCFEALEGMGSPGDVPHTCHWLPRVPRSKSPIVNFSSTVEHRPRPVGDGWQQRPRQSETCAPPTRKHRALGKICNRRIRPVRYWINTFICNSKIHFPHMSTKPAELDGSVLLGLNNTYILLSPLTSVGHFKRKNVFAILTLVTPRGI